MTPTDAEVKRIAQYLYEAHGVNLWGAGLARLLTYSGLSKLRKGHYLAMARAVLVD